MMFLDVRLSELRLLESPKVTVQGTILLCLFRYTVMYIPWGPNP